MKTRKDVTEVKCANLLSNEPEPDWLRNRGKVWLQGSLVLGAIVFRFILA